MTPSDYDIGIIGGGLAGLTCSIMAASAGYRVALIEKESYPFHRVCGEYISMESYDFLEHIGIPFSQLNLPVINNLTLSDIKGATYNFNLTLGGVGISRYTLDHLLYEIAISKGVKIFTKTRVTDTRYMGDEHNIMAGTQMITSKTIVASYGKRSNLDINLKRNFITQKPDKLNNYIGVKYHIRYPHAPSNIALHNFNNGYCGISAIEDNKCCLCYLTTAENLQKSGNSLARMEEDILFKNPILKKIFNTAEFLYEKPLTISQISFTPKTRIENHALMAGDAAGLITPLCGNGMSMAMNGAKIAFKNIDLFLQHKISREKMELQYKNEWDKAFQKRLFTGRMVQRMFGNDTTTSMFLKVMHAIPILSRKIISLTHGQKF